MTAPDRSALGSAALRAMHVRFDAPPHVFVDEESLLLASPDGALAVPPGMEPENTRGLRASIVARARCIEDLVAAAGVGQYVILGAGLDSFAQRRTDLTSRVRVFEIDRPGPQAWKRDRLAALGRPAPTFVPVDFEAGGSWWDALVAAGFDPAAPAVVASTGVSMYLTREAVAATLAQAAGLAPGSTFVMSYATPGDQPAAGFTSFTTAEIRELAAGFRAAEVITADDLGARYFAGRADGLWPSAYQDLLVART